MFTSKPPTCAGRTLDLPRKDWDVRYLRPLGNSDIASNVAIPAVVVLVIADEDLKWKVDREEGLGVGTPPGF